MDFSASWSLRGTDGPFEMVVRPPSHPLPPTPSVAHPPFKDIGRGGGVVGGSQPIPLDGYRSAGRLQGSGRFTPLPVSLRPVTHLLPHICERKRTTLGTAFFKYFQRVKGWNRGLSYPVPWKPFHDKSHLKTLPRIVAFEIDWYPVIRVFFRRALGTK